MSMIFAVADIDVKAETTFSVTVICLGTQVATFPMQKDNGRHNTTGDFQGNGSGPRLQEHVMASQQSGCTVAILNLQHRDLLGVDSSCLNSSSYLSLLCW